MDRNIVVVFDENTRLNSKINTTDLVYRDIKVISSLADLSSEYLRSKDCTLILLEGFFKKEGNYSSVILFKEIYNLDCLYLGSDSLWLEVASTFCTCYKIDINGLNAELVESLIYRDINMLDRIQSSFKVDSTKQDLPNRILSSTNESESAKSLAREYLSMSEVAKTLATFNKKVRSNYEDMSSLFRLLEEDNREMHSNYMDIIRESIRVNGVLKQYEVVLQKDFYEKVDITQYPNRPTVLYLKEYEELVFLLSLLETLYSTVYYQFKMPVKLLMLADSSFSKRLLRLPPRYHILYDNYTKGELIENDYLVKVGNYSKVLDLLLTNEVGLGLLIVVDCKDNTDTVLSGSYIKYNLCRNLDRCESYSISPDNTICNNNKDHVLSWDYYSEYGKLTEDSDRFLFLSSREVIRTIYKVISIYKGAV